MPTTMTTARAASAMPNRRPWFTGRTLTAPRDPLYTGARFWIRGVTTTS